MPDTPPLGAGPSPAAPTGLSPSPYLDPSVAQAYPGQVPAAIGQAAAPSAYAPQPAVVAGAPYIVPATYVAAPTPPKNGLGIAGMVCGIVGIVLFWIPIVGIVLAILAVVLGALNIKGANEGLANNKGMGITGVVLGVVVLAAAIITLIVAGSVLASVS